MAKPFSPFRIHKSKDGQFYFTIVSKNGNIIVTSETYTRKANCVKAINGIAKIIMVWSTRSNKAPLYIDTTK